MFWKLTTFEEKESGEICEITWAVCRAQNEAEAEILLLIFVKYQGLPIPKDYDIKESNKDLYYEFLEYSLQ